MALVGFLVLALLGVPSLAQAMSPQSLEPAAVRAEHRIEEQAESRVSICYNYGCVREEEVRFRAATLTRLVARFAVAQTAEEERAVLGEALGRLYRVAAIQTPIAADRGGNYADNGVSGMMDCIDHSTTTTRLLRMMEKRGLLRYHRVLDRVLRKRFLIFEHYSAQIEALFPEAEGVAAERFAVDSWFYDNGHPAAIIPLARWLAGESPNDAEQ